MSGESTTALSDDELEQILTSYKSEIPLGWSGEQEEFRSHAGAQEKTALLYLDGRWYLATQRNA